MFRLHLYGMISAAEVLGKGMDFIRADFYDTPDRLYLGELTTTPLRPSVVSAVFAQGNLTPIWAAVGT